MASRDYQSAGRAGASDAPRRRYYPVLPSTAPGLRSPEGTGPLGPDLIGPDLIGPDLIGPDVIGLDVTGPDLASTVLAGFGVLTPALGHSVAGVLPGRRQVDVSVLTPMELRREAATCIDENPRRSKSVISDWLKS
jgi:hypothetical protein